ncbi:MAG: hypothetical protein JWM11_4477 [Planctomycetaceae bacterium]|nr:hypothetical protein [Planctomycetaceae bacterium]
MSSQQRNNRIQWARRLISLVVLIGILGSFVPLPAGLGLGNSKDLSQPFPCQYRACGCRSAEQCWKRCCCFTNSQKVAWAKSEQVDLPVFVVNAAKFEQQVANQKKQCCRSQTTCDDKACDVKSHPSEHPSQATAARQSSPVTPVTVTSADSTLPKQIRAHQRPGADFVIGVLVMQCEGQGWFWNSLPWSILPELPEVILPQDQLGERAVVYSESHQAQSLRPPVPPPRCVRAAFVAV